MHIPMTRSLAPLLLAVALPVEAGDADAALKRFVEGVQTLSASFEQVQKSEDGAVLQTTSGRMWLSRPPAGARAAGKFRWSYERPYEQLVICDGDKMWFYDPDLAQVTVQPAAQALSGTPAELLSRRSTLGEEFALEDGGVKGDVQVVRLKPRSPDGDFKSIELSLRGSAPTQMVFHDQLGGTSEVRFGDVRVNGKIDEAQFRFKPPKGVEVVEGGGDRRE